jgi:hypothetical protein
MIVSEQKKSFATLLRARENLTPSFESFGMMAA